MKPTATDIAQAIHNAETGNWLDPDVETFYWNSELYDPEGKCVGNGQADTPAIAMALAWLHCWAPDALIAAYVEPGTVPFDVPEGWRFEVTPPAFSS